MRRFPFPPVGQDTPEGGSGESCVGKAVWPSPSFPALEAAGTINPFAASQRQGQGLPGSCHLEGRVPLSFRNLFGVLLSFSVAVIKHPQQGSGSLMCMTLAVTQYPRAPARCSAAADRELVAEL